MSNLYLLFGKATEYADEDLFVAEWSTSSIFDPDPDGPEPDYEKIVVYLREVWTAAHLSVKDIRKHTGMTQAEFAAACCIPYRTIVNWEVPGSNARQCPPYIRLMLAQIAGIVDLIHL